MQNHRPRAARPRPSCLAILCTATPISCRTCARKLESRGSGLIITAIVLAGLMAVSAFGDLSYFGVIRVPRLGWEALLPRLVVTVACGVLGGVFARLIALSLTGSPDRFSGWRQRYPVRFAACGGLAMAVIGLATGGATFGAGSEAVKQLLAGEAALPTLYVTLKFVATWLTAWCGVPGGIFAPSLSIGAGVGHNVTAFIIVMEMVDGHAMVLSLMAAAMLASLVPRMVARPLYETLADAMVGSATAPAASPPPENPPVSAPPAPADEGPRSLPATPG